MKNSIFCAAAILFCGYTALHSQIKPGALELSMSGNVGSVSRLETFQGRGVELSQGYLSLIVRPGFYVFKGLAVEPEIFYTSYFSIITGGDAVFLLNGNLAYNFSIPDSRITPFVLIGYGTGNGIPPFKLFDSFDESNFRLLNVGAGVKLFVAKQAALRIEYRFQRYSQGEDHWYRTVTTFKSLFFGFSVFLH